LIFPLIGKGPEVSGKVSSQKGEKMGYSSFVEGKEKGKGEEASELGQSQSLIKRGRGRASRHFRGPTSGKEGGGVKERRPISPLNNNQKKEKKLISPGGQKSRRGKKKKKED